MNSSGCQVPLCHDDNACCKQVIIIDDLEDTWKER
jgi:hypothetical protein